MSRDVQGWITPELIEKAEEQINEHTKRIEFYITEYSIELLANKMRNGDFFVPGYQREFTWEFERKSRFIESILMGLPIPFLFFWEVHDTGKLEIVDGSQRLRTIEEFLLGGLALGELEELSLLSGFRFQDLTESRQRKVKNRSIRGIILNEHADDDARFDLFERINTGSKIVNPAELRRGARGGKFLNMVIELAKDPTFVDLAPVSSKQENEREREELITRFFAYGDGLEEYRDRVSAFLFSYTKKMNDHFDEHPADTAGYIHWFNTVMSFVDRNFPYGFRKTPRGKVTPRARFEAIAIGSLLALQQQPDLIDATVHGNEIIDDPEFKRVTSSDGANARSRLEGRIFFVRDKLLGMYK